MKEKRGLLLVHVLVEFINSYISVRRTYELVVCQQPLHARMCGFGEKDRRPIDPPPIVQLIVKQNDVPVDIQ